jgi:hypothetical protein
VAFGTAEAEEAGVVADEGYAFGGVDGAGAEVACLDSGGRVSPFGLNCDEVESLPHGCGGCASAAPRLLKCLSKNMDSLAFKTTRLPFVLETREVRLTESFNFSIVPNLKF